MEKKARRIVVVGPESTGKSTLAKDLANHFGALYIPEFARTYLEKHGPDYELHDLEEIIQDQKESLHTSTERHTLYDTDLLNLYLWKLEKYGIEDAAVLEDWVAEEVDLFLLTDVDVPWVYDPLRESENLRQKLFEAHLSLLEKFDKPYVILSGDYRSRTQKARQLVQELIESS